MRFVSLALFLSLSAAAAEHGPTTPAPASAPAVKLPKPSHTSGTGPTFGEHACSSAERWTFGPTVPSDRQDEYEDLIKGNMKPVQGFAEALGLRAIGSSPEAKMFGEFWVSRALMEAKLYHIAHDGFTSIASRPPEEATAGVQIAALECLLQLEAKFTGFSLPKKVVERLAELQPLTHTPAQKEVVWLAAGAETRELVGESGASAHKPEPLLALLVGSGLHEKLARAFWAAKRHDHSSVIRELEPFLAPGASVPPALKRFVDPARIMIARAFYTIGRYDQAAAHLRQIAKSSNLLAVSLDELSWAFLMNERYSEAIGTAMNLDAGGLRHTFAPESGMVMAMALNELCQYPESVRAIQLLRKHYEAPYKWLDDWSKDRKHLYPLAVEFLRKAGKTPERIGSEWVRSPVVIASQDEINLIFDEKEAQTALGKAGVQEQKRIAEELVRRTRELVPRLVASRTRSRKLEDLPPTVRGDLQKVHRLVAQFRRLQHAAPIWQAVLGNYKKKAPVLEHHLVERINQDLEDRSLRMLAQLEEISENVQLIEVEIYNGASSDIIWQNAHPDYVKVAKQMKDEAMKNAPEKVWDWGRAPAGDVDEHEIWEDELGSFKANLYNNCSSKDKYLALKMRRK
jgi:hypothetical protein